MKVKLYAVQSGIFVIRKSSKITLKKQIITLIKKLSKDELKAVYEFIQDIINQRVIIPEDNKKDLVEIKTPAGIKNFEIIDVKYI